jgi:hypothetical protein
MQRSGELYKGCRAVKILKCLSKRQTFSKKYWTINFHKNSSITGRVSKVDGRTDGQTDMTKLIFAFGNFSSVPKKYSYLFLLVSANLDLHQWKLCFALRFVKRITPKIGTNICCIHIAVFHYALLFWMCLCLWFVISLLLSYVPVGYRVSTLTLLKRTELWCRVGTRTVLSIGAFV